MTMQQTFSKWSNIVDAKCSEANFEVNTTFAGVKMKFRIFAHLLILILVCIIAQQKNNRNERGRVRGQVREGDWEGVTNGKRERERIKCMDLPDASWIYLYTLIYINTISPARPAAKWMSVWFLFLWLSLSLSLLSFSVSCYLIAWLTYVAHLFMLLFNHSNTHPRDCLSVFNKTCQIMIKFCF